MASRGKPLSVGIAVALVCIAILSGCSNQDGSAAEPATAVTSSEKTPVEQFLFMMPAAAGTTMTAQPLAGEDERFTLRLTGVDPVTKFADRPFRDARIIPVSELASEWDSWFASSAPNAVLTYDAGNGTAPQSIVVTLTNPQWEPETSAMTFTAVRIYRSHETSAGASEWKRPETPPSFRTASLFIDSVTTPPACQITINGPLDINDSPAGSSPTTPVWLEYGDLVENVLTPTSASVIVSNGVENDPAAWGSIIAPCSGSTQVYLTGCSGQYVDIDFNNTWSSANSGPQTTSSSITVTGYNGAGTIVDSASTNANGTFAGFVGSNWILNVNCG